MKKYLLLLFTVLFIISSCGEKKDNGQNTGTQQDSLVNVMNTDAKVEPVKRFGSITGLKADRIDYYKKLHAAVWPGVLKKIKECNIQNYSIYLKKIEDNYFLFSYFEYTGENFEADMKKMAGDSTTQRWWKETDPAQVPLPEAAAKHEIWTGMEEVFHIN